MIRYRVLLWVSTAVCLTLLCAFLAIDRVDASPAAPIEFTLTQPDGFTFTATQWGDEWNNGVETAEGYSILQMGDGWWAYADLQTDGLLGPALHGQTPRRVGIDPPAGLPLHLRPGVYTENPNSPAAMALEPATAGNPLARAAAATNVKTLLLLASFDDTAGTYSAASFQSCPYCRRPKIDIVGCGQPSLGVVARERHLNVRIKRGSSEAYPSHYSILKGIGLTWA